MTDPAQNMVETPGIDPPPPPPLLLRRLWPRAEALLSRLPPRWEQWLFGARRAALMTTVQYCAAQGMRLVSSLILTRLLFPEAFGVMAVVQVFLMGLAMFSDLGLGPSIVQNKDGDQPRFYNTAWTLQIARGFLLWCLAAAIALPASAFFDMPELAVLLPIVGVTAAIGGLESTAIWTARRHLRIGRVLTLDISAQALGILTTIGLALVHRLEQANLEEAGYNLKLLGAMCLAAGAIVGASFKTALSHVVIERGVRNRPAWDRGSFDAIFHFGKWVFLSTLLAFFVARTDVMLIGRLLGDHWVGIYSIGQNMAQIVPSALLAIGWGVVYPLYSRIARERPEQMRTEVSRIRRMILWPCVAALSVLIVGGGLVVRILYDHRYADAGTVLQILSLGAAASFVCSTYTTALLATGRSRETSLLLSTQLCLLITGSLAGYTLAPTILADADAQWAAMMGLVTGVALAEWLNYPIVLWRAAHHNISSAKLDVQILLAIALVAALASGLRL